MSTAIRSRAPSFGLTAYPDGVIYFIPYALGVRAPYANPAEGSPEDQYNQAYGHGAYDASVRVGLGGIVTGLAVGALVTWWLIR